MSIPSSLRFSPNGRLFQVEYASLAVERGSTCVGIRGSDIVVLAVEKKTTPKLQDSDTIQKIFKLDKHVLATFAGLHADARILVNKARVECQSYKLTVEDRVSIDYITKYIAEIQQKFTQSTGVRPFGTATLLIGFNLDGTPKLFKTLPSGKFSSWKATATGRNSKDIMEFLEKELEDETLPPPSGKDAIALAVKTLLEVVDPHSKEIEVAYITKDDPENPKTLPRDELQVLIDQSIKSHAASSALESED